MTTGITNGDVVRESGGMEKNENENVNINQNSNKMVEGEKENTATADRPSAQADVDADVKSKEITSLNGIHIVNVKDGDTINLSEKVTENPQNGSIKQGNGHVEAEGNREILPHKEVDGEEAGEETPMDDCSVNDKTKKRLAGKSLRELNKKQRYLLAALCILYFALYALLSLIGPFFPIEARKKGLSPFETGIVISTSWFVMFLMAPLVGILGTKIRLHYLTTGGVASAGLVSIVIGFLQFIDNREAFLALAIVLRILEGISVAIFCVTAWSVLIATMGDCIQMCMAVLMAVQGVAVIVSPLLGGVLYEAGGFITPFASLGILVVLSTPLSWWVMKKVPDCGKEDVGSVKKFVSNIAVFLTALFIATFSLTFKFLESYVALYVKDNFGYGPRMAGIILSLACLSFIITAVIWAQIIRLVGCVPVMTIGSILAVIVLTFIAPGHFLHYSKHPWQVFSMTCLFGVAFAASQTPGVPRLLELARKQNMPESYLTYGLVSACFNSAFDLGCFTGPLIGGAMYNYMGFAWSAFALACLVAFIGTLILLHHLWERYMEKKQAKREETGAIVCELTALSPQDPSNMDLIDAGKCQQSTNTTNHVQV